MNRQFYKELTFWGWLRIIYAVAAIGTVIYFWFNPIPKYEKNFINEKYHYKIVKQPGFFLAEGQPLEKIVFERSIKRRRYYIHCKDIYYGVEVYPWSLYPDVKQPEDSGELLKFGDTFIEHNRESIIEVRETKVVDIKPNHKGIEASLIINDPDTGKPTYYYDTRIWAYGNMYVVYLNACIETTNTKEHRAERDKDYGHTYKQILDSVQIDENIKSPGTK